MPANYIFCVHFYNLAHTSVLCMLRYAMLQMNVTHKKTRRHTHTHMKRNEIEKQIHTLRE